jgi:hypothetical protein
MTQAILGNKTISSRGLIPQEDRSNGWLGHYRKTLTHRRRS